MADKIHPTGWIYDLRTGTETVQGQAPDQSVSLVHTQADVKDSYTQNGPVTASKEGLVECSLLRLRDTGAAGNGPISMSGLCSSLAGNYRLAMCSLPHPRCRECSRGWRTAMRSTGYMCWIYPAMARSIQRWIFSFASESGFFCWQSVRP